MPLVRYNPLPLCLEQRASRLLRLLPFPSGSNLVRNCIACNRLVCRQDKLTVSYRTLYELRLTS